MVQNTLCKKCVKNDVYNELSNVSRIANVNTYGSVSATLNVTYNAAAIRTRLDSYKWVALVSIVSIFLDGSHVRSLSCFISVSKRRLREKDGQLRKKAN